MECHICTRETNSTCPCCNNPTCKLHFVDMKDVKLGRLMSLAGTGRVKARHLIEEPVCHVCFDSDVKPNTPDWKRIKKRFHEESLKHFGIDRALARGYSFASEEGQKALIRALRSFYLFFRQLENFPNSKPTNPPCTPLLLLCLVGREITSAFDRVASFTEPAYASHIFSHGELDKRLLEKKVKSLIKQVTGVDEKTVAKEWLRSKGPKLFVKPEKPPKS